MVSAVKPLQKKRRSGIELLRIVAMLFIIFHHMMISPVWDSWQGHTTNFLIKEFLMSFGKIGVAIFFIITGYFLHNRKTYNWKKVFVFLRPVWFYSFFFLGLAFLWGLKETEFTWPLNLKMMLSIVPVSSNSYWFMTAYAAVFLLSPYLKKMFDSLEDKALLRFTILTSCFAIFGQTLTWFLSSVQMSPILTACLPIMYVLIGYTLKRYKDKLKTSWAIIGFLVSSLALAVAPIITLLAERHGYRTSIDLFWSLNSFQCLVFAVSIFILFAKFNFYSKVVNYIASLMLGVYLIHYNIWMIQWLWRGEGPVDVSGWITLPPLNFLANTTVMVLTVLVGATCLEAIRKVAVVAIKKVCTIESNKNYKLE